MSSIPISSASGGASRDSDGGRNAKRARPPLGKLFDKLPPHSVEAEMSLLGSMLLDPQIIADVLPLVNRSEDFYSEAHAAIFEAIVDVYDRFHSGDIVQIAEALRDKAKIESAGGPEYLVQLAESVPSAVNAPHYARIVGEKAKLRRLIHAAGDILYEAYHSGELGPEGAREVLDRAEMAVFEIAQQKDAAEPQRLAELLQLEMDRIEASEGKGLSGVATGYLELDELLRGFQPGELIIIAARPSMGKTALALNIAEQMALGGSVAGASNVGPHTPVALFSLEMSKSAVTQRLISARSGVSSQALRGGHRLDESDFNRLIMACSDLREAPMYIDDTPGLTVLNLRARARRLAAQHGVRAIMIDYLQLLTAPGSARESRQVEVAAISRGVKALARELNVPVVCLSQLNRASEQREGNRPRMSDLRESGSIEQDADVIILLHREDYYHTQDPDWQNDPENADKIGTAELIVAKQRNGPTGVVRLTWDAHTTRFKNFSAQHPPAGWGAPPPQFDRPQGSGRPAPGGAPPFQPGMEAKPTPPAGRGGFSIRPRTGPIDGHRDGGGPDAAADDRPKPPFGPAGFDEDLGETY